VIRRTTLAKRARSAPSPACGGGVGNALPADGGGSPHPISPRTALSLRHSVAPSLRCSIRFCVSSALALFPLPALAQHTGSIHLRPVARVAADRPVTLADIARLDGPSADALASIIVLDSGALEAWTTLDAAAIRAAIDDQADPVWGHLTLLGSTCQVRSLAPLAPTTDPTGDTTSAALAPTEPTSVRAVLEQRLAHAFNCTIADLRLDIADRDAALMALSAIGRTVDVQPTGYSERLPLRITIYQGERILRSDAIRVGVLIRRTVALATAGLDRDHLIADADLTTDTRWMPPDLTPISPEQAVGLITRTRVAPGEPLITRDVETPLVIRRGQTLQVHAALGAISLQIPARALQDGRTGDTIRCVTLTTPTTGPRGQRRPQDLAREFLARLAGPGIAVAVDEPTDTTTPGIQIASPGIAIDVP